MKVSRESPGAGTDSAIVKGKAGTRVGLEAMAPPYPYAEATIVTTFLGMSQERRMKPGKLAMYMAITGAGNQARTELNPAPGVKSLWAKPGLRIFHAIALSNQRLERLRWERRLALASPVLSPPQYRDGAE